MGVRIYHWNIKGDDFNLLGRHWRNVYICSSSSIMKCSSASKVKLVVARLATKITVAFIQPE
jgi:hypothetical protein